MMVSHQQLAGMNLPLMTRKVGSQMKIFYENQNQLEKIFNTLFMSQVKSGGKKWRFGIWWFWHLVPSQSTTICDVDFCLLEGPKYMWHYQD